PRAPAPTPPDLPGPAALAGPGCRTLGRGPAGGPVRRAMDVGTDTRQRVRAVARARGVVKAAVVARGTDVTEASATRSCLVVAPHPDDETLGCGVTIMRKLEAGPAARGGV